MGKMMNTGNILIVDDDAAIRSTLSEYFESLGHRVIAAVDGEDALKKFVPDEFDCIISDLMMPKIDGLELLKLVRMQDNKTLFVMITGYPNIDSAVNAIKAGAYDYIAKPFHMEDLRIKVERALGTRKTNKSLKTVTGLLWGIGLSIPFWLILGVFLGLVWK
jgi:two-component system response regulator PilR (NtrC family)